MINLLNPPHDHLVHCPWCFMDTVFQDCTCLTPLTYQTCWGCKEQKEYEGIEARRNLDY